VVVAIVYARRVATGLGPLGGDGVTGLLEGAWWLVV